MARMPRTEQVVYATKRIGQYPQIYVSCVDENTIKIVRYEDRDYFGERIMVSRREARMLARRITQCLEATR